MSTTSSSSEAASTAHSGWGVGALSPIPLRTMSFSLTEVEKQSPDTSEGAASKSSRSTADDAPPPVAYIHAHLPSAQRNELPSFDFSNRQAHPQQQQQYPPPIAPALSSETCSSYPLTMTTTMMMMQHPHPTASFASSASSPHFHQHHPPPPPPPMHFYNHHHHPAAAPPHMYYPPPPYPPYGHMYGGGYPHYPFMPPVAVEYITKIQPEDVLSGRGGATNSHSGNREFRRLVKKYQKEYLLAKKRDKPAVAAMVVDVIRQKGGRFLKKLEHQTNHLGQVFYVEIGDERAKEKACQALREGAPDLRRKQVSTPGSHKTTEEKSLDKKGKEESETEANKELGNETPEPKSSDSDPPLTVAKEDAAQVTPIKTKVANEATIASSPPAVGDVSIMIRPCPRLMPNRKQVDPFPIDHLSPEEREMYLRDFLPPSNPPRPLRPDVGDTTDHGTTDNARMQSRPPLKV